MSQITTYCYDSQSTTFYSENGDLNGRRIERTPANSEWNREDATHKGECSVPLSVSLWLEVRDGVITQAASSAENLGSRARHLCYSLNGMSLTEVRQMLDTQPAGQSAAASAVAAALAAACDPLE